MMMNKVTVTEPGAIWYMENGRLVRCDVRIAPEWKIAQLEAKTIIDWDMIDDSLDYQTN